MKKLIVSFVGGAVAFTVHAQVLFTYEFPGSDPGGDATVPAPEHLTLSAFSRTQVNAASQIDAFSSSQWTQGAEQDPNEFVSFAFRPDIGYEVALTSLSWDTSRSSTGPQMDYCLKMIRKPAAPGERYQRVWQEGHALQDAYEMNP